MANDAEHELDALSSAMAERWLSPRKLVEMCDEDNSGELQFEECVGVLQELRLNVSTDVVHAVFDALDTNNSGTLSSAELESALSDRIEAKITIQENAERGALYDDLSGLPPLKMVSLVAHNEMKQSMMAFVASHLWFFSKVSIITTGSTGRALEQKLGITVDTKVCSGPLGGDQEIGAQICEGNVGIVFFFRDPLSAHPHESDIQALTRLCDVHNCAMASNPATANGLMEALADTPIGTVLPFNDGQEHDSDVVSKYKARQQTVISNVSQ